MAPTEALWSVLRIPWAGERQDAPRRHAAPLATRRGCWHLRCLACPAPPGSRAAALSERLGDARGDGPCRAREDTRRPLPARLVVPLPQPRLTPVPPLPEPRRDAHGAARLGDRRGARLHLHHVVPHRMLAALCLCRRPHLRHAPRCRHGGRRSLAFPLQQHSHWLRADQLPLEWLWPLEPALGDVDAAIRLGILMAGCRRTAFRCACSHRRSCHRCLPLRDRLSGIRRSRHVRAGPTITIMGEGRSRPARRDRCGRA